VVIGSGTGSGFQSTSAAAAATSGGGKLSRAVIKTGQVLATRYIGMDGWIDHWTHAWWWDA
jgi:hypothetical protein